MRLKPPIFMVFLALTLAGLGCAQTKTLHTLTPEFSPGTYDETLWVDNRERTYLIHIPACFQDGVPIPLVLMFHGGGGQASVVGKDTGWIEKSEEACFLVVLPNGVPQDPDQPASFSGNPQLWNDGSGRFNQDIDDVAFIEELIRNLFATLPVDPLQVYAVGFSNGASMVFRLGIELDHYFAAIAPVAGALWISNFSLDHNVSLFYLTGTEDPLNPLAGGVPRLATGKGEPGGKKVKPPVDDHIQHWVEALGCKDNLLILENDDLIEGYLYPDCQGTAVVQYYFLLGVGHHWPGGKIRLPQVFLGPTTDQINATDLIWDFFQEHPGD